MHINDEIVTFFGINNAVLIKQLNEWIGAVRL